MGGNDNTTTTNGRATKCKNGVNNNNKKKNKDKNKDKPTGPPFEGLSKEEIFKEVVINAGKPAIQARNLRDVVWTH